VVPGSVVEVRNVPLGDVRATFVGGEVGEGVAG
jgi:hypothetical protein